MNKRVVSDGSIAPKRKDDRSRKSRHVRKHESYFFSIAVILFSSKISNPAAAFIVKTTTYGGRIRTKVPFTELNAGPVPPEVKGTLAILEKKSPTKIKCRKFVSPWIPQGRGSLDTGENTSEQNILIAQTKYNLRLLQQTLKSHDNINDQDAMVVMESLFTASRKDNNTNDYRLLAGAADFLSLIMSVEEDSQEDEYEQEQENRNWGDQRVVSRDALVASAFHYCDCIVARESGIYDIIDNLMRATGNSKYRPNLILGDTATLLGEEELPFESGLGIQQGNESVTDNFDDEYDNYKESAIEVVSSELVQMENDLNYSFDNFRSENNNLLGINALLPPKSIQRFGEGAIRISLGLARVKKAEICAHTVLSNKKSSVSPNPSDAESLRGLLLSVSDDWRALSIRSTACLYRLKGILRHNSSYPAFHGLSVGGSFDGDHDDETNTYSQMQIVREAREALTVYAPLAERLGMHSLKSELENDAFQILYKRQYNVANSIYAKKGETIHSVTSFLKDNIEQMLRQDLWLSPQLESLKVTSRVKEPFSLWKKLLKNRRKALMAKEQSISLSKTKIPSITDVHDAIAMRIILKAKKSDLFESEESLRSREEFLCYYIQKRFMKTPLFTCDQKRTKDYISVPKPNGYQSLHLTASVFRYGCEWPFELQIRSEDMHTKCEFGGAAHWDYKVNSGESNKPRLENADLSTSRALTQGSLALAHGSYSNEKDDVKSLEFGKRKLLSLPHSSDHKSYVGALSSARENILSSNVFVFFMTTSEFQGRVISLPIGSSIADALFQICRRRNLDSTLSGDDCDFDVFLNGERASLHDCLENGDNLVVPSLVRKH